MNFSIIIPMYNAEQYADICLKRVTEIGDCEIVIVDDGSNDSTGNKCDSFAENFPDRVKVIHQENCGQLLSRCNAIREASGDYLIFLDVDDILVPGIIDVLSDAIYRNDYPDMVIYSFFYEEDGNLRKADPIFEGERVFSGDEKKELYKKFFTTTKLNNVWTKAVRRTVFERDFPDYEKYAQLRCAEDQLHSMGMVTNAERIVYIDKPLYRYRIVNGSVTRNYTPESIERFNTTCMYEEQLSYIKKWGLELCEWKQRLDASYIGVAVWTFDKFYNNVKSSEDRKRVIAHDWRSFVPDSAVNEYKDNPYIKEPVKRMYEMMIEKKVCSIKTHYSKKALRKFLSGIRKK